MNASVGAGKYEVITWLLTHIARHKLQSTLPAKTQFTFMYTAPKHTRAPGPSATQMPFASSLISPKWMRKMRRENGPGKCRGKPAPGKCEEKIVALN